MADLSHLQDTYLTLRAFGRKVGNWEYIFRNQNLNHARLIPPQPIHIVLSQSTRPIRKLSYLAKWSTAVNNKPRLNYDAPKLGGILVTLRPAPVVSEPSASCV